MDIDEFQDVIGVYFNDPDLLKQALTHRSYINEHASDDLKDNERFEFLGDAILDYVTADMLFQRFPEMSEGVLTRLRSALVKTESLAQIAAACRVGEALFIGKGEEQGGGRERANNLCGAFEALVGAIYLDQGLEAARDFVTPLLTELQKDVMDEAIRKDARSQFQEWAQARYDITPNYHVVSALGPDHKKEYQVEVTVGAAFIARGSGRTKQSAAQSAARAAMALVQAGQLGDLSEIMPPE